MNLYALSLALTLSFGGSQPLEANLDIYPTFAIQADLPGAHKVGFALPHVILIDEDALSTVNHDWRALGYNSPPLNPEGARYTVRNVRQHEYLHIQQWEALGPGLPFLYALTLGQPFEDYMGSEMWQPTDEQRRCPMLRFGASSGGESVAFMPCWRWPG